MFEIKEKDNHSYYPSFLYMDVVTPDYLDAITHIPMDERTEAAFLHEYIHYLQDLTTLSGLAKIETVVDHVKWAAHINGSLKVPLEPQHTFAYNLKPNYYSMRLSSGQMYFNVQGQKVYPDIDVVEDLSIQNDSCPMPNGALTTIQAQSTIIFRDSSHKEWNYHIGEGTISESMAYLIETSVFPGVLPVKEGVPYRVVDKVMTQLCYNIYLDRNALIALCDVCLMHPFPGAAFYHMVKILQRETGYVSAAKVYLIGLGGDLLQHCKFQTNWEADFEKSNKEARKQLSDYFIHPYWKNIREVLMQSMDGGCKMRIERPTFFLDIATQGRIWRNGAFKAALNLCGCMGVKTSQNLIYNIPPQNGYNKSFDSDWFVCLHQIYNILFTNVAIQEVRGQKYLCYRCELKEWCSKSFQKLHLPDITTNSRNCIECPWENVTESLLSQCSFGRLWAAYNLPKIKIRKR